MPCPGHRFIPGPLKMMLRRLGSFEGRSHSSDRSGEGVGPRWGGCFEIFRQRDVKLLRLGVLLIGLMMGNGSCEGWLRGAQDSSLHSVVQLIQLIQLRYAEGGLLAAGTHLVRGQVQQGLKACKTWACMDK